MYILKVDGTREEIKEEISLEVMQKAVGGFIEIVATNDGRQMIMNEEGKLKGYSINHEATALVLGVLSPNDVVVGDVIIANVGEIE